MRENYKKREEYKEILKGYSLVDDYGGILIYLPEYLEFVSVQFGDGTNLDSLSEENDDYLMYDIFEFDGIDFVKGDGGMIEFNSEKSEYGYDIINTVVDVLFYHYEVFPKIIPIHTFSGK